MQPKIRKKKKSSSTNTVKKKKNQRKNDEIGTKKIKQRMNRLKKWLNRPLVKLNKSN